MALTITMGEGQTCICQFKAKIRLPNTISYLNPIVMFALSLTIYKIFADQIKCQKLDLEMKVKVKE